VIYVVTLNTNEYIMKHIYHPSESRGYANHGWLNSHHSFSFAGYHNPERMYFGALRVLNDDSVSGGMGFSRHPHNNMEIVSIPLEGELQHQDNMGNSTIIKSGEVQLMSAGTGVEHSEKNNSSTKPVKFLQIWVFPKVHNITPNYDQKAFDFDGNQNSFQKVVSPNDRYEEGVKINQDAWFSIAVIEEGKSIQYQSNLANTGTYFFILDGSLMINNQILDKRDGYGLWDFTKIDIIAKTKSRVLAIEVPMKF
jgi:redox-sensitive bicupin YhaK (pirin superfamily)